MHHTNQRADHIPYRIAFTNHEAIKAPSRAKAVVEIPRLSHAVRPDQSLANHEDLVRLSQLRELLERRHEPLVVVPPPGRIDQHDAEPAFCRERHGVRGDVRGVFAVPALEQLDLAALALAQLLQIPHVHAQLLHGAGAERVGGGDEHAVVVLEQEEGDLG